MPSRLAIGLGFVAYFIGVPLLTALISPWLYWALVPVGLDPYALRKLVFRVLELLAIVGVWPLLYWWLGGATAAAWGLARGSHSRMRDLGIGIGIGILMFVVPVALLFGFDIRQLDLSEFTLINDWIELILKAIAVGMAVALVEELWIRGGLYTAIDGSIGKITAIVITALLYASVHFVRIDIEIEPHAVNWRSGFLLLSHSLDRLANVSYIWDSWLTLFAGGLLLAQLRSQIGNIMLGIGIHAGWVIVIQVVRKTSIITTDPSTTLLAGSFDVVLGLPLVVCGFIAMQILFRYRLVGTTVAEPSKNPNRTRFGIRDRSTKTINY